LKPSADLGQSLEQPPVDLFPNRLGRHIVNRLLCVGSFAALSVSHAVAQAPSDGTVTADQRVALVIGNAAYMVGRLGNPVQDARAMADSPRHLGFEVLAHENLSYQEMRRAVAEFGERITSGGVGLFYYSGHGIQVGKNYLVPVDADIKNGDPSPAGPLRGVSVLGAGNAGGRQPAAGADDRHRARPPGPDPTAAG
jgi:Caspase domain